MWKGQSPVLLKLKINELHNLSNHRERASANILLHIENFFRKSHLIAEIKRSAVAQW